MNSLKREWTWPSQACTRRRDKGSYCWMLPVIAPWGLPLSVSWTRRGERFILRRAGSEIRLSACSFSSNARHSSYFSFPFGRFHSRSSQSVLESSVRLRVQKSLVSWTIRSRSVDENLRPEKSISSICLGTLFSSLGIKVQRSGKNVQQKMHLFADVRNAALAEGFSLHGTTAAEARERASRRDWDYTRVRPTGTEGEPLSPCLGEGGIKQADE